MNTAAIIEGIGYAGSALVLVSFLMTSVFRLRVVNTVGSVIFMIYALLIRSYPTAWMNLCLVLINLHFLWKMMRHKNEFELVEVGEGDAFLAYTLERYGEDIRKCFPGISLQPERADRRYLICTGGTPAGIFLGRGRGDTVEIDLDYSTPEYRDFSLGRFLMKELPKKGVARLCYRGSTEHHMAYLEKMGFTKTDTGYERRL